MIKKTIVLTFFLLFIGCFSTSLDTATANTTSTTVNVDKYYCPKCKSDILAIIQAPDMLIFKCLNCGLEWYIPILH